MVRWADIEILEKPDGVILSVRVQPRASRKALAGQRSGALQVRLTAPALEDRANRQLLEFLSLSLKIPQGRLSLAAGKRSRNKKVAIEGLSRAALLERLERTAEA